MKKIIVLASIGAALVLSACGKSDLEKKLEEGTETSKKMGGDVSKVPRVIVAPDATPDKNKEGGK